jgi:hypothetical protein
MMRPVENKRISSHLAWTRDVVGRLVEAVAPSANSNAPLPSTRRIQSNRCPIRSQGVPENILLRHRGRRAFGPQSSPQACPSGRFRPDRRRRRRAVSRRLRIVCGRLAGTPARRHAKIGLGAVPCRAWRGRIKYDTHFWIRTFANLVVAGGGVHSPSASFWKSTRRSLTLYRDYAKPKPHAVE